jgi:hypothetical protein
MEQRLVEILAPAYQPCNGFAEICHEMKWHPAKGYIPRGFVGATGAVSDVELVLVFAEPGDPQPDEKHSAGIESALKAAVRDPAGAFAPQAFLCTDEAIAPVQVLSWFVRRWQMEVTFEEARAHLGMETQRRQRGACCLMTLEIEKPGSTGGRALALWRIAVRTAAARGSAADYLAYSGEAPTLDEDSS